MPSATTNSESFLSTRKLSSLISRFLPTSVAAQKDSSMAGPRPIIGITKADSAVRESRKDYASLTVRAPLFRSVRPPALADVLGDRLMAGRQTLDLAIKVRILVPEPGRKLNSRPDGLAVRTVPSHGTIPGSIPGRVTGFLVAVPWSPCGVVGARGLSHWRWLPRPPRRA